jgi:hypothetical protein
MPSCIRLIPGPEEAVMARTPAEDAPNTIWMAPISLSAGTKTPPDSGSNDDATSAISLAGVIGYPKNALHPAATAPRITASFPLSNRRMHRLPIPRFQMIMQDSPYGVAIRLLYAAGLSLSVLKTRMVIAPGSGQT